MSALEVSFTPATYIFDFVQLISRPEMLEKIFIILDISYSKEKNVIGTITELPPNAILFGQVEHAATITQRDMLAAQLTLSNANAKTLRDCGFWCWVDEYLPCPCGNGPCKLRSATISKKRFYCCPLSKSKEERGCGFLKWFKEVNGELSTSTPSTTVTPTFATSTTIEDLEIKYKIELAVTQAKIEMLQSITEDLAKIKLKNPVREPTPGSTSHSRTPAPQSNRRRSATAVQSLEPAELVQSLISAFTAQGASHTSGSNDDTSDAVVHVLQEMVSSYEIDNTLFFKSLKFLGGSNEHTYRLMFIRLRLEQRVSFLEALMS
ncbi:hypothetical protein GIB67_022630 [Kingdonia uniflora]|uniref:Zinc finger GRF-type domain-containing protein n=1 Tax=Kingdonia uniflora TaxID=39325 RepID=A0A7J7P8W8_9MAGN|nr:hypothetical protein GIB67_022630 [Kingdonia uniflora]